MRAVTDDGADVSQWDLTALADSPPESAGASAPVVVSPRPRRRGLPLALLVATDVLVVVAVVIAVWQWRRADDLADTESTRRDIAAAAGAFGEALLTYDHEDLTTARDRVIALATDRFAEEYTAAFTGGLAEAITDLQATSDASVRDVYVTDVVDDSAKAVVTLDSEVNSTAGTRRTINSYLDMTLLRVGGEWRIDSVTSVAALDQETTPADGGAPVPLPDATTTTTIG